MKSSTSDKNQYKTIRLPGRKVKYSELPEYLLAFPRLDLFRKNQSNCQADEVSIVPYCEVPYAEFKKVQDRVRRSDAVRNKSIGGFPGNMDTQPINSGIILDVYTYEIMNSGKSNIPESWIDLINESYNFNRNEQ